MKKLLFIVFMLICLVFPHDHNTAVALEQTDTAVSFEYEFREEGVVITRYTGTSSIVHTPKTYNGIPIVGIGEWAFVTSAARIVVLHEGLLYIEDDGFAECALSYIYLPNTLISIGDGAFGFSSIKNLIIPDSVTDIGVAAFAESSIKNVRLSDSLSYLPESCFFESLDLGAINVPEGIEAIGYQCFYYCRDLKAIELPSTLRSIDGCAFKLCKSLERIILPEGLCTVGDACFMDCLNLKEVYIPSSVVIDECWDEYMFLRCPQVTLMIFDNPDAVRYAQEYGIDYVELDSWDIVENGST